MSKVRIDKWLWSIRIFKSRTLATDACKSGKVKIGETVAKPASGIGVGEIASVKKDGFTFQFKVVQLLEKRVGAAIAVTCYEDVTPQEEKEKYTSWYLNGAAGSERREKGAGRPTKKERRDMDEFKTIEYDWEDAE